MWIYKFEPFIWKSCQYQFENQDLKRRELICAMCKFGDDFYDDSITEEHVEKLLMWWTSTRGKNYNKMFLDIINMFCTNKIPDFPENMPEKSCIFSALDAHLKWKYIFYSGIRMCCAAILSVL
jgi:hypothetical protein